MELRRKWHCVCVDPVLPSDKTIRIATCRDQHWSLYYITLSLLNRAHRPSDAYAPAANLTEFIAAARSAKDNEPARIFRNRYSLQSTIRLIVKSLYIKLQVTVVDIATNIIYR